MLALTQNNAQNYILCGPTECIPTLKKSSCQEGGEVFGAQVVKQHMHSDFMGLSPLERASLQAKGLVFHLERYLQASSADL